MAGSKSQIAVLAVLGVIVVSAGIAVLRHHPTHVPEPLPDTGVLSSAVRIDMYVDGSGSMQNLLAGRGENYLHDLLTRSESTLRNPPVQGGWADETVSFYKFGRKVTPLTGDGPLTRLANNPAEFNESRTPIEVPVVDNPPGSGAAQSRIKIIVTDLYQSDHAHETPADALTSRYLSTDTAAIAVAGIRNPYSGPVEDLPGVGGRSLPNAADTMPFYIIVAGDHAADVRESLRLLISGTGLQTAFDRKQAFSAYFSKDPGTIPDAPPTCDWRHSPHQTRTGAGECLANHFGKIAMLSLRSGTVRVSWPGPAADPDLEEALGPSPEIRVNALVGDRRNTVRADETAGRAATICTSTKSICVDFDRAKLRTGRTYLFRLDVLSTTPPDTFRPDSPLMKRWGVEDAEVMRIAGGGDRKFPPLVGVAGLHAGRTPGLSQFLMALQGQMYHLKTAPEKQVRAATYYVYVKAR